MRHPATRNSDKILIFDVETNGKHPCDSMLTLSGILHDYKSGEQIDQIDLQFKPEGEWNFEAQDIHQITYREAIKFPSADKSLRKFCHWLDKHIEKPIALGHHSLNIGGYFDWGVLQYTFMKHLNVTEFYNRFTHSESTIDFLKEAVKERLLDPIKAKDKAGKLRQSYKLNLWANRFNIELDHHNAQSDAKACSIIYWKLRNL